MSESSESVRIVRRTCQRDNLNVPISTFNYRQKNYIMDSYGFVGNWEVINYSQKNTSLDQKVLEGIRFKLDETGDVTWTVPGELKNVPLFWCDTYEAEYSVLRFGTYKGHVIEFNTEPSFPTDIMVLHCDSWCKMKCKRIENRPQNNATRLDLLKALEEGYFSNIKIMAANNKEFAVHSCILRLLASDLPWDSEPPPFTGAPEQVLGIILHYLYTECLPNGVEKTTIEQVITVVSPHKCLTKLIGMCRQYLENMLLKQQILDLVSNIHTKIDNIIQSLVDCENRGNSLNLSIILNHSIKEVVIIVANFFVLCDAFSKRQNELTTEECNEIMKSIKLRLPAFLLQVQRFFQTLSRMFNDLTVVERREIAASLAPQIETSLNVINHVIVESAQRLSQIIVALEEENENDEPPTTNLCDIISKPLITDLKKKDMGKLADIHHQIKKKMNVFSNLRTGFNRWSSTQRVLIISRNMESLIEEIRLVLVKLEEFMGVFEDRIEWREFKFSFKLLTGEISGILQKLTTYKPIVKPFALDIVEMVQKDELTRCFHVLGILDSSDTSSSAANGSEGVACAPKSTRPPKSDSPDPPQASSGETTTTLPKISAELFASGDGSDMVFEIVYGEAEGQDERVDVPAHRVIVASRCELFKKALTSGMKESIERRIVIQDTNPNIFKIFLEYLYSGQLTPEQLNNEQLSELLLLSDRYEVDSLKLACEYGLRSNIDTENVIYLLGIADQFCARNLRESCINFISRYHKSIDSDLYYELPVDLQTEVLHSTAIAPARNGRGSFLNRFSNGLLALQRGFTNLNLPQSQSEEDITLNQDTARLEECISQLRDIVGDAASHDRLVQVVLAADFDLCRAINYFYSRDTEDGI